MTVPPTPTPASSSPTPPPSHSARSRVTRRGLIDAAVAVAAGAALTPVVMANTTSDTTDSGATGSGTTDAEPGTTSETFPKTRAEQATGEAPVEAAFPIGYRDSFAVHRPSGRW